jgi:putative ABC transport system permease protein
MKGWFQDFRLGLRYLRRTPGFTTVAVVTLALGIGASAAVFSIVDAVLVRPLPYRDADQLVAVWSTELRHPESKLFAPYADFQEFKEHSHSFQQLAAATWARAGEIVTWNGSPHQVVAIPVSADFFSLLSVPAELGRTFGPDDRKNGCTVVLAHPFWQKELGAPQQIAGTSLVLSGQSCTVSGVMPRSFEFYPKQTSLWTLIQADSQYTKKPLDSVVGIFGRLRPGLTKADAETELVELHRNVVQHAPAANWVSETKPIIRDLRGEFTWLAGRNLRTALFILSFAVALLILIACLNVTNLLLIRCMERRRELAVRNALGSGRLRLIRQLLIESALLAAFGTLLGILLAELSVHYFNIANPIELPPGNEVGVNLHVIGLSMALTALTTLLCAFIPAWRVLGVDVNEVLKQTGRSAAAERHRTSQLLVVGQAALSMILVAGAGLTIESSLRLGAVPLGFDVDNLLTAEFLLPPTTYSKPSQRASFYSETINAIGILPSVQDVALCSALGPYNGGGSSGLSVWGRAHHDTLNGVNTFSVSERYFDVLEINLLSGRRFNASDNEKSLPVAIVNSQLARQYFPGEDPLGQRIKLGNPEDQGPWRTIIGVVRPEKRTSVYQEMGYVEPALVYLPITQESNSQMGMVMRISGDAMTLSGVLQRSMSNLDPNVPVYNVKTMAERYAEFLSHPRFRAILMGILAGMTSLLAAIGFYGVLGQLVRERTQEIGLRLALGAQRTGILSLVISRGARLAIAGVLAGTAAGLLFTRTMAGLLYGIRADDPAIFALSAVMLLAVAMLACYVPAHCAARVDPIQALRYE